MLAKSPKRMTPDEIEAALFVPTKPPEIAATRARLQDATEARLSAATAHQSALRLLHAQNERNRLGFKEAVAPTITHAECDALGQKLAVAQVAEEQARADVTAAEIGYEALVVGTLKQPLSDLHSHIEEAIDRLDALLTIGIVFRAQVRADRMAIPYKLPGACDAIHGVAVRQGRAILMRAER